MEEPVPTDHETVFTSFQRRPLLEEDLVPTAYEKRSCAGMGPRLRALWIERAREDPMVELGDRLSSAAAANDAELVDSLLQQRADPNHVHPQVAPDVPLVRTSSAAVAQVLLRHPDVDVNWKDINGFSVLQRVLLHHGHNAELLDALLQHPRLDVHEIAALRTAVSFASAESVGKLLDHSADVNAGALHHAISRTTAHATQVVDMLLQRPGLDINARVEEDGATALHFLSRTGSLCVEVGQSEKKLRSEAAARQVAMALLLLRRPELEANAVDAQGCSALHAAARAGRADVVRTFLRDGRFDPSVWQRDGVEGLTPLECAEAELQKPRKRWECLPCTAEHAKVVRMLSTYHRRSARLLRPLPQLRPWPGTWALALRFCFGAE